MENQVHQTLIKRLQLAEQCLPLTLNEVLKVFTPDDLMASELEYYLEEWGNKPVVEFVDQIIDDDINSDNNQLTVWYGDMEPFNIIALLNELIPYQ